jgi:hypothetical protein
MTAETMSAGDTAADQLRELGTRGVLVQMAQRGQISERLGDPRQHPHDQPMAGWPLAAASASVGGTAAPGTNGHPPPERLRQTRAS